MPEQNSAEFNECLHTDVEMALTPESELLRQITSEQVRCAIENLPWEYREVLLLRELEQMSYEEIAKVIQASRMTVASRLSRGRGMLRQSLGVVLRVQLKPQGH